MSGATLTTLDAFVDKIYPAMVVETQDSVKTPFRDLIPAVQSLGGKSWDWRVHPSGNTSTVAYSESDAVSAAGNEVYYNMTIAASTGYLRTMVQFTGHALDAMKGQVTDGVALELKSGIEHHLHAREGALITAAEAAIDDAGSYGGQTRANANCASYEDAVTPTLAEMQLAWQTMSDDPIVADMGSSVWAGAPDFVFDYLDVASGVAYFEHTNPLGVTDAGKLIGGKLPEYNGRPLLAVAGLTSGTCLILTPQAKAKRVEFREVRVEQMGKSDDSTIFSITSSEIFVIEAARYAGKLT